MMTFDEFLDSRDRNAWVEFNQASFYVRKNAVWPGLLDLANMSSQQPGSGDLRAFLARYGAMPIYVENVLNERLAGFFRTMGWQELGRNWIPCFLNRAAVDRQLGPGFNPSPRAS